jgi:CRISPR-associated exonuclease Cas4
MNVGQGVSFVYTGTQINYCFVCKRKLWLFSHALSMEQTSDAVSLGKLIHETSYARQKTGILRTWDED